MVNILIFAIARECLARKKVVEKFEHVWRAWYLKLPWKGGFSGQSRSWQAIQWQKTHYFKPFKWWRLHGGECCYSRAPCRSILYKIWEQLYPNMSISMWLFCGSCFISNPGQARVWQWCCWYHCQTQSPRSIQSWSQGYHKHPYCCKRFQWTPLMSINTIASHHTIFKYHLLL